MRSEIWIIRPDTCFVSRDSRFDFQHHMVVPLSWKYYNEMTSNTGYHKKMMVREIFDCRTCVKWSPVIHNKHVCASWFCRLCISLTLILFVVITPSGCTPPLSRSLQHLLFYTACSSLCSSCSRSTNPQVPLPGDPPDSQTMSLLCAQQLHILPLSPDILHTCHVQVLLHTLKMYQQRKADGRQVGERNKCVCIYRHICFNMPKEISRIGR